MVFENVEGEGRQNHKENEKWQRRSKQSFVADSSGKANPRRPSPALAGHGINLMRLQGIQRAHILDGWQ